MPCVEELVGQAELVDRACRRPAARRSWRMRVPTPPTRMPSSIDTTSRCSRGELDDALAAPG